MSIINPFYVGINDMLLVYISSLPSSLLFRITKMWNHLRVCQWMNEERKCGVYTQWNDIQHLKERNLIVCDNMDEPGRHYVKRRK
jgi:hypothetical protein